MHFVNFNTSKTVKEQESAGLLLFIFEKIITIYIMLFVSKVTKIIIESDNKIETATLRVCSTPP